MAWRRSEQRRSSEHGVFERPEGGRKEAVAGRRSRSPSLRVGPGRRVDLGLGEKVHATDVGARRWGGRRGGGAGRRRRRRGMGMNREGNGRDRELRGHDTVEGREEEGEGSEEVTEAACRSGSEEATSPAVATSPRRPVEGWAEARELRGGGERWVAAARICGGAGRGGGRRG